MHTEMRRLRRVGSAKRIAFCGRDPPFGIQWAEHTQYVQCLFGEAHATTSCDQARPHLLGAVDKTEEHGALHGAAPGHVTEHNAKTASIEIDRNFKLQDLRLVAYSPCVRLP